MTPGEAWLRYHAMRRWAAKVVSEGPDMSLLRFMPAEAVQAAHEARVARLDARLRELRDRAVRLTEARGELV